MQGDVRTGNNEINGPGVTCVIDVRDPCCQLFTCYRESVSPSSFPFLPGLGVCICVCVRVCS